MSYRVMLIFVLATLQGVWSTCPEGWELYSPDHTCLKHFQIGLSWGDARASCKNHNADLVWVETIRKEKFVQNMIIFPVWTDHNDFDGDGIQEHINGRKATMFKFFEKNEKKTCGVLWRTRLELSDCYKETFYMCEMQSEDTIESEQRDTQVLGSPECNKDDWQFDNTFNTYLLVVKSPKNFSTAALHCQRMSARVLEIHNRRTGLHLYETTEDMLIGLDPTFYWIGLRSTPKKKWYWTNGVELKETDYQPWRLKPKTPNACAAVLLNVRLDWREMRCSVRNNYICQSTRPCGYGLTLLLNGVTKVPNNTIVDVPLNSTLLVHCTMHGFITPSTQVFFRCSFHLNEDDSDTTGASETVGAEDKAKNKARSFGNFTTYPGIDGKICWCESEDKDGKGALLRMMIRVVFAPVLLPGEMDHRLISVHIGDDVSLHFKFLANPKPHFVNLVRRGVIIESEGVVKSIQKLENDDEYAAVIILKGFRLQNRGSYHLYTGNDIGEPLHLRFDLTVANKTLLENMRGKPKSATYSWTPLLVVSALLGFSVLIGVLANHKRSKDENTEDNPTEDYMDESMNTTEDSSSSTASSTITVDNFNNSH